MADLGLKSKFWLQTMSSQLLLQALIVYEVISQMLSLLILPNTREVEKCWYYSYSSPTGTEVKEEHIKRRDHSIVARCTDSGSLSWSLWGGCLTSVSLSC